MQAKQFFLVGAGALVLMNISIVTTLVATGFLGSEKEPDIIEIADPELLPTEPKKPKIIHSMAKAMYVCEDKVHAANATKNISYEFDTVASRYNEDEGLYSIFIETHTASRSSEPQKNFSVICNVSDSDLTIAGYTVLPM
jgi:hypothetical protein